MLQAFTEWLNKPRLKLSCGELEKSQLNLQKRDELGLRDSIADIGIQGTSISISAADEIFLLRRIFWMELMEMLLMVMKRGNQLNR